MTVRSDRLEAFQPVRPNLTLHLPPSKPEKTHFSTRRLLVSIEPREARGPEGLPYVEGGIGMARVSVVT